MLDFTPDDTGAFWRLILVLCVAVAAHLAVRLVRMMSEYIIRKAVSRSPSKVRTVNSLVTSVLIFSIYFGALGWAITEAGVSLSAYFASASIIGLAV